MPGAPPEEAQKHEKVTIYCVLTSLSAGRKGETQISRHHTTCVWKRHILRVDFCPLFIVMQGERSKRRKLDKSASFRLFAPPNAKMPLSCLRVALQNCEKTTAVDNGELKDRQIESEKIMRKMLPTSIAPF